LVELQSSVQERAQAPLLPLLRLRSASGLSPPAFGVLSGVLTVALVLAPAFLLEVSEAVFRDVLGGALFFGLNIAILTGFAPSVIAGAAQDLRRLAPVLPLDDESVTLAVRSLSRMPLKQQRQVFAAGAVLGLVHSWLLAYAQNPAPFAITQYLSTVLLWVAMWLTVPAFIINARLFSALGQIARPDLLRPSRHSAFGAAALRPGLLIVGLLCAYSLLFIGDDDPLNGAVWIGVGVSLFSLLGIVSLPLRGIRRRIREQRARTLADLDHRLDAITSGDIASAGAEDLFQLDALLDMRERVARAPSWPFDVDAVRRILLYTVLPPLTWAAAAIVEMFIDSMI
jgi:hypothetical protein